MLRKRYSTELRITKNKGSKFIFFNERNEHRDLYKHNLKND